VYLLKSIVVVPYNIQTVLIIKFVLRESQSINDISYKQSILYVLIQLDIERTWERILFLFYSSNRIEITWQRIIMISKMNMVNKSNDKICISVQISD